MNTEELIPIETKTFVAGSKALQVSVGTNSPQGGNFKNTGSCLRIAFWQTEYNMEWNASIVSDENTVARYQGDEFQAHRPMQVAINFAGDEECELAIEALKYTVEVLEAHRKKEKPTNKAPFRSDSCGHYDKKNIFAPQQAQEQDYELDVSQWHKLPGPFRKEAQFDHNADTRATAKADIEKAIEKGAKAVFAISNMEGSLWIKESMDGKQPKLDEEIQDKIQDSLDLKDVTEEKIAKFLWRFPRGAEEYEGYKD